MHEAQAAATVMIFAMTLIIPLRTCLDWQIKLTMMLTMMLAMIVVVVALVAFAYQIE
jgi:hypothetical protein